MHYAQPHGFEPSTPCRSGYVTWEQVSFQKFFLVIQFQLKSDKH